MDFKKFFPNKVLIPLLAILAVGILLWKFMPKAISSTPESDETLPAPEVESIKDVSVKPFVPNLPPPEILADDTAIQEQLDHDRQEQKQTKYLKTKLEQTNLELEQEKAFAEINKLKMENRGAFREPASEGQKNFPEVKVEYIGGDSVKKEAILSIEGSSYQVKEKSIPTDDIQVVSISDSSVTLHFSVPQALTRTIDYKPE